jgi:hypothetical protein
MKIKMTTSVVGPGVLHARNSVYDLPDKQAEEYVTAKFATVEAVNPVDKREKAIRKPLETR